MEHNLQTNYNYSNLLQKKKLQLLQLVGNQIPFKY